MAKAKSAEGKAKGKAAKAERKLPKRVVQSSPVIGSITPEQAAEAVKAVMRLRAAEKANR